MNELTNWLIIGFAGKTDIEQAQMDMIQGCMEDIVGVIRPYFKEQDPERKVSKHIDLTISLVQIQLQY